MYVDFVTATSERGTPNANDALRVARESVVAPTSEVACRSALLLLLLLLLLFLLLFLLLLLLPFPMTYCLRPMT
ncbi:MAG: hypothetical protein EHM48_05735 [Planctomycetaceae bacterium]|nr:MAG: hypothetical protein EHM48_05735 [Planctomycetaceae bacterium]